MAAYCCDIELERGRKQSVYTLTHFLPNIQPVMIFCLVSFHSHSSVLNIIQIVLNFISALIRGSQTCIANQHPPTFSHKLGFTTQRAGQTDVFSFLEQRQIYIKHWCSNIREQTLIQGIQLHPGGPPYSRTTWHRGLGCTSCSVFDARCGHISP